MSQITKESLEKLRYIKTTSFIRATAFTRGFDTLSGPLLKACECLQDMIDSGYDQAGHCANALAEIKRELGIE